MSNGRTIRRKRAFDPDAYYGTVAGWCSEESDLPELRQSTHDTLIALMGDNRTGGVRWLQFTGDEAVERLERLKSPDNLPELADSYRRIGAHLREYGGWLVIASAEGSL